MLKNNYWLMPILLIFTAALARLIPHAPNFTPILSLALFSGAIFKHKRLAFLIPFIAMIISDALVGFHELIPALYLILGLIIFIGSYMRKISIISVTLMSTISGVIFFIFSNLAVWALTPYYAKNLLGLSSCFIAALPFFTQTLLSTYLYSSIMFGIFKFYGFKKQDRFVAIFS
jgi:hypothetical protein